MDTLSIRKFAGRLGLAPTTLQEYLKGRMPPADFIVRVCERFNVSPWWLLSGKGEIRAEQPGIVSEKSEGFQPIPLDADRRRGVLFHRLQRIMDEGDKTKIEAVKAQLKAFDPGEKKQGMACAENEGVGTKNNNAA